MTKLMLMLMLMLMRVQPSIPLQHKIKMKELTNERIYRQYYNDMTSTTTRLDSFHIIITINIYDDRTAFTYSPQTTTTTTTTAATTTKKYHSNTITFQGNKRKIWRTKESIQIKKKKKNKKKKEKSTKLTIMNDGLKEPQEQDDYSTLPTLRKRSLILSFCGGAYQKFGMNRIDRKEVHKRENNKNKIQNNIYKWNGWIMYVYMS